MKRFKVEDQKEFEARQGCFDFGVVCRAVLSIAVDVKKALGGFAKGFLKAFRMPVAVKKPHQLVLPLDGMAQIPMM